MKDNQGPSARFNLEELVRQGSTQGRYERDRHMVKRPDGEWVSWEDYERLEKLLMDSYQENRELRRENTRLIMEHTL